MEIYVTCDRNFAIGNKEERLVSIPAEHKMTRKETAGRVLVMGRKTWEKNAGLLPLEARETIVLTRDGSFDRKGLTAVHSLEELWEKLKTVPTEDVCVMGGESVFRQLFPYADVIHMTKVDIAYEADRFFPDPEAGGGWKLTAESEENTYFDLEYYFLRYERI